MSLALDTRPGVGGVIVGRSGRWSYSMRHACKNHVYAVACRHDGVRIETYHIGPWAERTVLRKIGKKVRQFERAEGRLP